MLIFNVLDIQIRQKNKLVLYLTKNLIYVKICYISTHNTSQTFRTVKLTNFEKWLQVNFFSSFLYTD